MNIKTILSCLIILAFFAQNIHAQKEEAPKRKMTIVTKTVDENGKETVTTVVKEGAEVTDEEVDQMIKKASSEDKSIDVEVNVEDDGTQVVTIKEEGKKEVKQQYKIIKKTQEIEMEDGEKEEIIIEKQVDEKGGQKKMIFITEDGETHEINGKDVKVIQKKGEGTEKEITVTVEAGENGDDVIWIEKMEGEEGDVITIEEETTETTDENGKTTKTVKKRKKIVKKGN